MSSSDSQRPPSRNELQRRLSSSAPPPPEQSSGDTGTEPPEWRSERFAELVAAEIREFSSKPDAASRSTVLLANASSRVAGGAVQGLTNATTATARITAAGARNTRHAVSAACLALGRAIVRVFDLIGGGVIALLRTLGRSSLSGLRLAGRVLRGRGSAAGSAVAQGSGSAAEQASASTVVPADATGSAAPRGPSHIGSTLRVYRRAWLLGLGSLLIAVSAFNVGSRYAPVGKRALAASNSRWQAALLDFGAGLHRALVDVGLVEPIPEAAAKPEPPPHLSRYVLEIVTVPEGAIASFAGQELTTPARFELDELPALPLRVSVKKPGLAPIVKRIGPDAFVEVDGRLSHSLHLTLRAPSAARGPEALDAPEAAPESPAAEAPSASQLSVRPKPAAEGRPAAQPAAAPAPLREPAPGQWRPAQLVPLNGGPATP